MRFFITMMGFCLVTVSGSAQSQSQVMGVEEAVNLAMENNPELNRIFEEIEVQESLKGAAWGIESPELFYLAKSIDGNSFTEKRYGISQSFTFPLTGYYQNRKVKTELEAVRLNYEAFRKSVIAGVKKAYTQLAYALKNLELVQKEVELADDLREIAKTRFKVGESTEIDIIQTDIRYSQAVNNLLEAEQQRHNARYALFSIIGLTPAKQAYDITYSDTLSFKDVSISQSEVLQNIQATPLFESVQKFVESAEKNLKAAKSGYLPDLRADYYRQDFGSGFDFNGFEIGVSIPLWFGLNEVNSVNRAKAEVRQAEWKAHEILIIANEEAERAWHGYEKSREAILTHKNFIEARSDSLLELTSEGYRMGELDLFRLLEAQRTFLNVQQQYYSSLKNYYLNLIELERFLPYEIVYNERR